MGGTTGAQLDQWCRSHRVKGFLGVFCSNNMPEISAEQRRGDGACFVVNHSPCDSPSGGSHWLGCRVRGDVAFWFDSFGLPPDAPLENELMGAPSDPPPHFAQWISEQGVTETRYNDRDVQSVGSDVCGEYASYFCKHGLPQQNRLAWRFLSSNLTQNDRTIAKLVRVQSPTITPRKRKAGDAHALSSMPRKPRGARV